MKIYNKEIIKSLQNAINKTQFNMVTFQDYSFMMPYIQIAEIKLQLFVDPSTDKRQAMMIIYNSDINSEYIKEWKTTAPGKFIINDYKSDNRDFIGNTLYHEVSYKNENNIKYKAIVRLLNEITNTEISEEDKQEYIKLYGDIKIDNKYFSVIKIYLDDDRHNLESTDSIKLLENPKISNIHEDYTSIIDNDDILNSNNEKEDEYEPLNLDPLF